MNEAVDMARIADTFNKYLQAIFIKLSQLHDKVEHMEARQRDILKLLKRNGFFHKFPKIILKTDYPVALYSDDHKFPRGTSQDNTRWQPFFEKCRRLFGEKLSLLDLGCSGGGLVADFIYNGHLAIGLEGSDFSYLRGRAEWQVLSDHLFTCDITKPFTLAAEGASGAYKFQVVSAWEVLEHIPVDMLPQLLKNIYDHLADDGMFLGTVAIVEDRDPVTGANWHVTLMPEEWWHDQFKKAGFHIYEGVLTPFDIPRQDVVMHEPAVCFWLAAGKAPARAA